MRLPALALAIVAGVMAVASRRRCLIEQPAAHARQPLKSKTVSPEERVDALSRAAVWRTPPPIARAHLGLDPKQPQTITCTFEITQLGGTAPKFDCRSKAGERLRVKYGRSPEVPSEVASAKLLHALGFGADHVTIAEQVRCFGCPAEPFITMKTLGFAGAEKLYARVMDPKDYKDFEWAAVERRHYGRAIETEEVEGWAFFELDLVDPKKGARAARARRCAAPARRVSFALGQQERESAAGVPVRKGLARRRQVLEAVCDASGCRRGLGAA